jgi:TonB-dependent starch-binding outer membrane protein SusC
MFMKVSMMHLSPQGLTPDCLLSRKWKMLALLPLLMAFLTMPALAQDRILVKGRILNDKNQPIAGATVLIKGTTSGTTTNADGDFEISAPSRGVLVVSSVDYPSREIPVNGQATINLHLTARSAELDQVVVIGYGTQRKRDVTGSTVSLSGETLNEINAPNVLNQLQGRAAGVDIVNNSTQIGSAPDIKIRGNRSLTGNNNPLIVVDGMAYGGNIDDINPDDIGNIDILKDASATAIYGSRGSNGVIIITTKHGTTGKPVTSYNGYAGMSNAIGTYRLFNGKEYAQFKTDAAVGNSNAPAGNFTTNQYQLTATEKANLAAGVNTDWQKLLLTTGYRTSQNLNVRGGNDRTTYFFGLGYYRETGVIHDQDLSRYSFNINLDHKVSERIKVGFTSFNTVVQSNRIGTDAYSAGERLSPLFKPYNADGTVNLLPALDQSQDAQQINPLTSIGNKDLIRAYSRRFQIQDNFYGEVKIVKGLKFRTTFGYGWSQTLNDNYNGPYTVFNTNATDAGSSISQQNGEGWQYTINNSLEYNTNFGENHKLTVLALQEVQKNHFQQQQFNGTGVPADFIQDYNWQLVNTVNPQLGVFTESALVGYMGRAIYSFNDKYLVTATLRTDGASVLATGHQWVSYPAVSLGWNMDKENFMRGVAFVNTLKLRAGYGVSSNAGINPYTTLGSLNSNFYNFGQGTSPGVNQVNGYTVNTAPNPNLTWERTAGVNVGVDFALFNNRLSGSVDYYTNQTSDILLLKNLPQSVGVTSVLTNAGKTSSRGLEISLSSINVKTRDFSWTTDVDAFFNREKIVALQDGLQQDLGNGWFVGKPLSVIYDYRKIGIWQSADSAQAAVYGVKPGDIRIQDINKDNAITAADRQVLGNFQPTLVMGMTNHFAYKNFDLNFVLFGRFGQKVVVTYLSADGGGAGYPFFMNSRVNQFKVNYWTPNNPTNDFPQPDAGVDGQKFTSTLTYRDGSFIKIRTIDLGYNFSNGMLRKAGIQSLRVYVSTQNPFILWAPLKSSGLGIDPEGNGTNSQNAAIPTQGGGNGVVQAVPTRAILVGAGVPPTRQVMFGVNLKF